MSLVEVFDYLSSQRENWAIYGMLILRPSEKKAHINLLHIKISSFTKMCNSKKKKILQMKMSTKYLTALCAELITRQKR